MHVVLISGPKQSGKSTLQVAVSEGLKEKYRSRVLPAQLKSPLVIMLYAMVTECFPDYATYDYERLKTTMLGGMTGREWMIELGNALRGRDPANLPRLLLARIEQTKINSPIVVIDDLGFEPEFTAFQAIPNCKTTCVYMEERGDRLYKHGEQFDGDSRVCLRGHADFIDPDPIDVVNHVIGIVGE